MSDNVKQAAYFQKLKSEEYVRAQSILSEVAPELAPASQKSIAAMFSELAARVRVVEEYLGNGGHQKVTENHIQPESPVIPEHRPDDLKIAIVDVKNEAGLGQLKWTKKRVPYRNIASGSEIAHSVSINRSNTKTLAINIASASTSKLLNEIKLRVDGQKVAHKIAEIDGERRILAHIPKSKYDDSTVIIIKAPEMSVTQHISISDIFLVPKLTVSQYLKKRILD